VSPDGAVLAFIGVRGALRQLYVRHLDQFEATAVPGTERATSLFFSPDGRAIGVITSDGTLIRVSLADNLVAPLARDVYFGGGSWGPDDFMTFVGRDGLWQVPSSGGVPQQITKLDTSKGEILHAWPSVAAGNVILFSSVTGTRRDAVHVEALSLPSGRRHIVAEAATRPMYAPSGHIVFVRDGAVLAAAFNAERLQVTGSPVRVLENVAVDDSGASVVGISASGSVVYATSQAGTSRLVWVSRQGVERTINDTPRRYGAPRLAPDGRSVVVLAEGDLWIQDMSRTTFTRLTTDDTSGNSFPVWAPDGTRVAFRTRTGMRLIDVTGSGRVESLPDSNLFGDVPSSISPDGDTLAFVRQTGQGSGGSDVFVLSLSGKSEVRPVLKSPAFEGGPQFSPDGRWLAYVSNESGQFQVSVRPFPGPDRKWQVSTDGGTHPRWNSNGKEIFYRNESKMMVVNVAPGSELTFSEPRVLFDQRYAFGTAQTIPNYDVSTDGLNFVMVKDDAEAGRLNVMLNWFEELKRLVPVN
jgi:serine/threonine-protein kinase